MKRGPLFLLAASWKSHLDKRNNIKVAGDGRRTMIFAHGFGCDQNMWRLLQPHFGARYRIVLFDLVGSGGSDLRVRLRQVRHAAGLCGRPGRDCRAVRARTGGVRRPLGQRDDRPARRRSRRRSAFASQVMVGPSPCYINDGDYVGGFTRGTSTACSTRSTATTSDGRARWRRRSWARPTSRSSARSSPTASARPTPTSPSTSRA